MDLTRNRLRDVAFDQIIRRGSAEILEEDEQGMLLRDTRYGLIFLVSDDPERGKAWLAKHEDAGYETLAIFTPELVSHVKEKYGLTGEEVCRQVVWTRPVPPELTGIVRMRPAEDRDISFIAPNYDTWDEWGHFVYDMGLLYVAELALEDSPDCGKLAGFVGRHMEDSMGLLFVAPEYRGMGIGRELECFIIGEIMNMGLTPYGHVIVGNEVSMRLQRELGLEVWDGVMSWVFPGPDK